MKKRILSIILSCAVFLSTMGSPAFAAGGSLVPSGFGALVKGLTYSGSLSSIASAGVGALFGSAVNWAKGGISIDASDFNNSFNKTNNTTINNTGATNNYRYTNISSTNYYKTINTTNNTYYNPVTNNYNTYNNISYNSFYNTYFIQGGGGSSSNYNTYITNNNNSVIYYVIDNSTQETYYYEIYYQLPDGRNSYDLEPEDIWGTYFIYNATNYREVLEDDGITRGLWHMDGNYKDSSAAGVGDLSSSEIDFISDGMGSAARLAYGKSSSIKFPSNIDKSSPYTVEFRFKVTSAGGLPDNKVVWPTSAQREERVYTGVRAIDFFGLFSNKRYTDCSTGVWYSVSVCYDGSGYTWFLNGKKLNYSGTFNFSLSNTASVQFNYNYTVTMPSFPSVSPVSGTTYEWVDSRNLTVLYDEIRLSNKVLYSGDYTPRNQPFDTNKVLVVPDTADMTDTTIAVKSSVPVNGLRVGGVRPTYPANGDVYVVEEKGVVKDVQQYQQDGWYSVTASLYIDGEWKLFVGFDISGFVLDKPDSGGSTDKPDSGGSSGSDDNDDSGGSSGGGFFSKILDAVFGGILAVIKAMFKALLSLLGTVLSLLIGLAGYIGVFLPFLPGSTVALIGSGVFIVLAIIVIKFIGGLL